MSGSTTTDSGIQSAKTSHSTDDALGTSAAITPNVPHAHVTGHASPARCSSTCDLHTTFGFFLSETPWSTNDDRKLHPQARAAKIKAWKSATYYAYIDHVNKHELKRAIPPGIVQVQIPFETRRRRDPHNYCGTVLKAIIDGLVEARAWPDDTPEWVGHREPTLWVPKDDFNPVVWVFIDHPTGWVLTDGMWRMVE